MPYKLFKFPKTKSPPSDFNLASLKNDMTVTLQSNITICSFHKQESVNSLNTHTIYVVYKSRLFQTPWFSIGFWDQGNLWANIHDQHWYFLGTAKYRELMDWIHICVEIDSDSKSLRASIHKNIYPTVFNVSGLSPNHEMNLRLGVVDNSMNEKAQFFGSVTNINIYRGKGKMLFNKISDNPCYFPPEESLLTWSSMNWDIVGNVQQIDIAIKTLCLPNKYINLRLPFIWRKSTAIDICAKLGNGKITDFQDPSNLSNINMESIYGKKYLDCKYFWTPYTDENEEGVFVNENTGNIER